MLNVIILLEYDPAITIQGIPQDLTLKPLKKTTTDAAKLAEKAKKKKKRKRWSTSCIYIFSNIEFLQKQHY